MTTKAVQAGDRWAGKDGTTYPVEAGQAWVVGRHTFVCSDLMASTVFDTVLNASITKPTLLYCDPPWGQGLVNSFRTKAGLGHATYTWQSLYRRIADLGHERGLPVWLEGSVLGSRDGSKIFGTMVPRGGDQRNWYWPIEYANHAPAGLYYSSTREPPEVLITALIGVHDKHTPQVVMGAYPEGTVIEPCAGLGGTPHNAHLAGWSSLNNEINPFRMSAALARLGKDTGEEPVRVI